MVRGSRLGVSPSMASRALSPRRLSSQTPWLRGMAVPQSQSGRSHSSLLSDGYKRCVGVASATIHWRWASNSEMSDRSVPVCRAPSWARPVRITSSAAASSAEGVGCPVSLSLVALSRDDEYLHVPRVNSLLGHFCAGCEKEKVPTQTSPALWPTRSPA